MKPHRQGIKLFRGFLSIRGMIFRLYSVKGEGNLWWGELSTKFSRLRVSFVRRVSFDYLIYSTALMPSIAMMQATPAAPAIGMSATAGTTVQTSRVTVTDGSLARPLAKAGLMQQRCFCKIRAPATAVPLQ
jgi:hypothetical protein